MHDIKVDTNINAPEYDDMKDTERDKYDIIGKLGKSTFGMVMLGENKNTKEQVAIKYFNLKRKDSESIPIQFIHEKLNH